MANSNRLRRPPVSMGRSVVASLVPTLLLFAGLLYFDQGVDRSIGLAGTLFAILTFSLQQVQTRNPPNRRVIFLAKSRSSFARNISRGLVEALAAQSSIQVRAIYPDEEPADPVAWQVSRLDTKDIRDADAVVLIPAGDDDRLWRILANLKRAGVSVIAVDVKPPNRTFADSGVSRPYFVGSDFAAGGERVAELLAGRIETDQVARVLLAVGPDTSWPARERISRMLYRLSALNLVHRVRTIQLRSWNANDGAKQLVEAMSGLGYSDPDTKTYVFCANDKILVATYRHMLSSVPPERISSYVLVGYDGATNDDDSLIVADCSNVLATVDTLPLQQGRVAGEYILEVYDGKSAPPISRFIEPSVLVFGPR